MLTCFHVAVRPPSDIYVEERKLAFPKLELGVFCDVCARYDRLAIQNLVTRAVRDELPQRPQPALRRIQYTIDRGASVISPGQERIRFDLGLLPIDPSLDGDETAQWFVVLDRAISATRK